MNEALTIKNVHKLQQLKALTRVPPKSGCRPSVTIHSGLDSLPNFPIVVIGCQLQLDQAGMEINQETFYKTPKLLIFCSSDASPPKFCQPLISGEVWSVGSHITLEVLDFQTFAYLISIFSISDQSISK